MRKGNVRIDPVYTRGSPTWAMTVTNSSAPQSLYVTQNPVMTAMYKTYSQDRSVIGREQQMIMDGIAAAGVRSRADAAAADAAASPTPPHSTSTWTTSTAPAKASRTINSTALSSRTTTTTPRHHRQRLCRCPGQSRPRPLPDHHPPRLHQGNRLLTSHVLSQMSNSRFSSYSLLMERNTVAVCQPVPYRRANFPYRLCAS